MIKEDWWTDAEFEMYNKIQRLETQLFLAITSGNVDTDEVEKLLEDYCKREGI